MTQLRSVTCHIGWPWTAVTCYPTQVNTSRCNPSQTGQYSIYLPRRNGRLSWPSWLVRLPTRGAIKSAPRAGSRTSDLSITSPTLNHCTTKTTTKCTSYRVVNREPLLLHMQIKYHSLSYCSSCSRNNVLMFSNIANVNVTKNVSVAKMSKFVAIRCVLSSSKCIKSRFRPTYSLTWQPGLGTQGPSAPLRPRPCGLVWRDLANVAATAIQYTA